MTKQVVVVLFLGGSFFVFLIIWQINLKRARILVKSHVLHTSVPGEIDILLILAFINYFILWQHSNFLGLLVSGCVDCNKEENILTWEKFMKPRIIFGVPLEDMVGGDTSVFKVFPHLEHHYVYYQLISSNFIIIRTIRSIFTFFFLFARWRNLLEYMQRKNIFSWWTKALGTLKYLYHSRYALRKLCVRIWMTRTWPNFKFPCR